jgi:SAM-dependent methyltransferase
VVERLVSTTTYQRAAAWLLGLEGVALLRSQAGDDLGGKAFVDARLAEIRRIVASLDSDELAADATLPELDLAAGYKDWSSTYDSGWNPLLQVEESVVHPLLKTWPKGITVLDAACGTGRQAAFLAKQGCKVIGVDLSTAMLNVARQKLKKKADLRLGDLYHLPLEVAEVDAAVCSLALTHLPDLKAPMAELRRVLRPGGQLVLSDIHWLSLYLGGVSHAQDEEGNWGAMPASRFLPSDYVNAALAVGFEILGCWEPRWGTIEGEGGPLAQQWGPDAAAAAYRSMPAAIVWHLRVPG